MRLLALLLIAGGLFCGPESAPAQQAAPEPELQEDALRATFDGRLVHSIDCDPFWHVWTQCPNLELYTGYAPMIPLMLRGGVLLEGSQPFRQRRACPVCVRGGC